MFWRWLFPKNSPRELSRRLDVPLDDLANADLAYHGFSIPKRTSNKRRLVHAPNPTLKRIQRRILRRLLAKLNPHPQATGFQPGVSFADNARCHVLQQVVIKLDLVDFFPSISARIVEAYFRRIGWNRKAASLLTRLTTHESRLPQGAPTSPRLSNLVNFQLDSRLASVAEKHNAIYTRYADDITFSLSQDNGQIQSLVSGALFHIRKCGYRPHLKQKFDIRRAHQRQVVTGLVVNQKVQLPRETRRWLRAVKHRAKLQRQQGYLGPSPTLSEEQIRGWDCLQNMIEKDAN